MGELTGETNLAELDADGEVREIHESYYVKETRGSGNMIVVASLG